MSAVSTGLRMAMMASGQQADVDSVAPDAPKVSAELEDVRRKYPPPTASRRRPWTPPLWRWWRSRAPRAPLAGALLQGGGGGCVAHPLTSGPPVPSNLHECYLYILIYECMYKYPCDKCLPHSTGLVPHMMPRPKEPFHLLAGRTQRRRLQEL